jgi:aminoglycoside phosphotransferase (APT) family kinase protein
MLVGLMRTESERNVAEVLERETGYKATDIEAVRTFRTIVWRCDDTFFVKQGTPQDNFVIEAAAHEVARSAGVPVPPVAAITTDYLILGAIPGVPVHDDRLTIDHRRAALTEAGAHLRALHEIRRPGFGWANEDLSGTRRTWIEHIESKFGSGLEFLDGVLGSEDIATLRDAFERRRGQIADVDAGSLLHGDLQVDHILVDPSSGVVTSIIDWGAVSVGDPVWDIAVLSSWAPQVINRLLAGYEPDEAFRSRLDALLQMYRACRHAWEYRAGVEDGFDESGRIPILREIIVELVRR